MGSRASTVPATDDQCSIFQTVARQSILHKQASALLAGEKPDR
jgi:hypothetical protein